MRKSFSFFLIIIVGLSFASFHFASEDSRAIFSPEEVNWLNAHPVITVAPDANYAPVEYLEDGVYKGLSIDYLNWISQTYDITFKYVEYPSWADIVLALKNKEVDLQSGMIRTPERSNFFSFTAPYSDMPSVLMIRKDFKAPLTNATLFDYRVGLINDFAVEEYIRSTYNPAFLFEFDNVKTALESLSTGQVDVLVLDIGQATYYVQKMGLTNVMITNDVQLDFAIQLSFATNKEDAILVSILDKALRTMPTETQQLYANKWLGIGEYTKLDTKLIMTILSILAAVTILFIVVSLWLLTLRKKDKELAVVNQQLQAQIHALNEAHEQLVESEKINALSRLAIGISHELNTPLGNGISITSYIQNLALQLHSQVKAIDPELGDSALHIEASSALALQSLQRAAKIIQDFQAVANYQQDTIEKEINLTKEVEMIATILSSHETMKSKLHLDLQPNIHTLMASNTLLQILTALMENSYLHAYNKEIGQIDIVLKQVKQIIYIEFRDYGVGVDPEILPNIFEPFYSTKHGSEQRLGLGLYNVFNIVTHGLNGKISASSDLEGGCTFTIQFPVKL